MSTWYEKAVFYHMYPLGMTGAPPNNSDDYYSENGKADSTTADSTTADDSKADSSRTDDSEADSTSAADHAGSNTQGSAGNRFKELFHWIPYLKELNISAVYIGPLFESRTHGYDTRDFRRVDRRLGGNEDFRRFVALCHEASIRVVVDGVFNHTGRDFFAFQDIRRQGGASRYCGWYKGINFGYSSPLGDPFGYESWHGIWELPCLNHSNQEVREYLLDTVRFWVEEFGIDGIRLDCANVLDFQFMKELRSLAGNIKPEFWLMGEVIHGDYSRWVNGEMLHSVTNYELHKSIYSAHNDHNYFELAHNIKRLEAVGRSLYTFVDNHDEDRLASKLKEKSHLKPVYALLFTLPGIPSVYYGSEWGIEGQRGRDSDLALRPRITAEEAKRNGNELTDFIRLLGNIHQEEAPLHNGLYQELLLTNRQYAFARISEEEEAVLLIAANNDENSAIFSLPCKWKGTEAADLLTGTVYPIEDGRIELEVMGNDAAVLKIT